MKPLLEHKIALITGGSSGIGAVTAKTFAAEGAKVVITARRQAALDAVAADIRAAGGTCLTVAGDVTDPADVKRVVAEAISAFGRVDVLVNNAGDGDFHTTTVNCTDEFWDKMIALNQTSVFRFCREVLPHMEAQGHGAIVNLSAIAGVYGNAGVSYSSAKAAVIAITRNIAVQYAGRGIRCNAVCPGPTAVDRMVDPALDGKYDKAFMAVTERHMDMSIPFSTAQEQANVIAFLASDASNAVNGQAVVTDAGRCL